MSVSVAFVTEMNNDQMRSPQMRTYHALLQYSQILVFFRWNCTAKCRNRPILQTHQALDVHTLMSFHNIFPDFTRTGPELVCANFRGFWRERKIGLSWTRMLHALKLRISQHLWNYGVQHLWSWCSVWGLVLVEIFHEQCGTWSTSLANYCNYNN